MSKGPLQPLTEPLPIRLALEDKSVHPAVAAFEHFDQQIFHLLPAVIAPLQQFLDCRAQCRAVLVDFSQSFASCAAIEFLRLLGDVESATQAGEQRLLKGEFAAKRINGANAKLGRQVEQFPAERLGVQQGAMGESVHGKLIGIKSRTGGSLSQFIKNPIAHLGGGGVGEGDGDHLAGLVHFFQQT